MNLKELFEVQKVLRDRIDYNEPDRFEKLVLALLVELGECANEWRGFKFWSRDQEPRVSQEIDCPDCTGYDIHMCCTCRGQGVIELGYENTLLEEYVDGLHFVLELGLEKGWTPMICDLTLHGESVNQQFLDLFRRVSTFLSIRTKDNYYTILELFVGLGKMLGFTWEQIETAYMEKNAVNHQRQESGY